MNTTNSTKGRTGHPLGVTEVLLFLGGVVMVAVILAAILYVSAPAAAVPPASAAPLSVNSAKDPHMIKEAYIAEANAKRAYAEQRRGEWDSRGEPKASTLPIEQRRGEWKVPAVVTGQEALQEQRRGEWQDSDGPKGHDALQGLRESGGNCYTLPTKEAQALCLNVR